MNFKKRFCKFMIFMLTLSMLLSGISTSASMNIAKIKKDISTATSFVVLLENSVKKANFNTNTAHNQLVKAAKAVQKLKSYGKPYKGVYNKLIGRIDVVKLKIQLKILTDKVKVEKVKLAKAKAEWAALEKAKVVSLVEKVEELTNTDVYDFISSDAALKNVRIAFNEAIEAIIKYDMNSSFYKSLMARIDAANDRIAKVMIQNNIGMGPAKDVLAELSAEIAAAIAVRALEEAPLVTAEDQVKALELAKTATAAVVNVKDADKRDGFTARIKVVVDKALALQTPQNTNS